MDVTTALLCDFAQVRENLLFVSSGGVTRLWRKSFPAPAQVSLAIVIDLDQRELERPHEVEVLVIAKDGDRIGGIQGGFQIDPATELEPGEAQQVPLVFNMADVQITEPGAHDVKIYIDGNHQRTVTFVAGVQSE